MTDKKRIAINEEAMANFRQGVADLMDTMPDDLTESVTKLLYPEAFTYTREVLDMIEGEKYVYMERDLKDARANAKAEDGSIVPVFGLAQMQVLVALMVRAGAEGQMADGGASARISVVSGVGAAVLAALARIQKGEIGRPESKAPPKTEEEKEAERKERERQKIFESEVQ